MITLFHKQSRAELARVSFQYSAAQCEQDALITRSRKAHDFGLRVADNRHNDYFTAFQSFVRFRNLPGKIHSRPPTRLCGSGKRRWVARLIFKNQTEDNWN